MAFWLGLTFAGPNAVEPPVISVSVVSTPAVLMPSTTRSATTDSAGFPERAALWAHHLIGRGDDKCARADLCGDWGADYF